MNLLLSLRRQSLLVMPEVMSTMRERRQWSAGEQKVHRVEMVMRAIKQREFARIIAPFRNYSVQLVLRRIVYRIRWDEHGDVDSYNLDGLLVALRARIFLMLFDARSLVLKELHKCTGCGFLCKKDRFRLKRCFNGSLFADSKTDSAYHALVMLHCSASRLTVPVSLLSERFFVRDIDDLVGSRMLVEACAVTLPPDLRDVAIGAASCGSCERISEKHMQICDGCRVGRYCGPECQQIDFSRHRLVCSRLFHAIGRHKGRRKRLENKATVEGSETFRSIVTRSVLLNSGRDCHDPSSSTAGPRAEPQVDTQWDG